jgi:hypothetical protein
MRQIPLRIFVETLQASASAQQLNVHLLSRPTGLVPSSAGSNPASHEQCLVHAVLSSHALFVTLHRILRRVDPIKHRRPARKSSSGSGPGPECIGTCYPGSIAISRVDISSRTSLEPFPGRSERRKAIQFMLTKYIFPASSPTYVYYPSGSADMHVGCIISQICELSIRHSLPPAVLNYHL